MTWVADRSRIVGQHGKPNRCLFVRLLSVKLTPSLECHRTAWRHGGASFFYEASSLHRSKWAMVNSSPPVNPWGGSQENPIIFGGRHRSNWQQLLRQQSSQKERERGMLTTSTWQRAKLHTSCSLLLGVLARRRERRTFRVISNESSEQHRLRYTLFSLVLQMVPCFFQYTKQSMNHMLFSKSLRKSFKVCHSLGAGKSSRVAPRCMSLQFKVTYLSYSPLQMVTPLILILSCNNSMHRRTHVRMQRTINLPRKATGTEQLL